MVQRFLPAILLASLAACGGVVDPSQNHTDTITGTVQVQGTDTKTFSVSKSGEVTIILTSLTPAVSSGTLIGIGWGQVLQNQCSLFGLGLGFTTVGATAVNTAITPGTYCVVVGDLGAFTQTETYTLTVSHP